MEPVVSKSGTTRTTEWMPDRADVVKRVATSVELAL
jgi:hypothetical protein